MDRSGLLIQLSASPVYRLVSVVYMFVNRFHCLLGNGASCQISLQLICNLSNTKRTRFVARACLPMQNEATDAGLIDCDQMKHCNIRDN